MGDAISRNFNDLLSANVSIIYITIYISTLLGSICSCSIMTFLYKMKENSSTFEKYFIIYFTREID